MNTSTINNLNFKSVIITKGGAEYIKNNANQEEMALLSDAEKKYKDYNWDLIVNKDGFSLYSPETRELYVGPFSLKKHRKSDIDNNKKEQLIIRTGKNNRSKFVIDYPSRESVVNVYRKITKNTGLSKLLMIFEILEGQLLSNRANRKLRTLMKNVTK